MQIHKLTVYEWCLISSRPKVEADVPYNCKLVRLQIYSIDEYTESLKLELFLVFLLQISKHNQLAVSNLLDLENEKKKKKWALCGHPGRGLSARLFLPRLNLPAHFFTMLDEGASSPNVTSMSW